MQVTDVHGEHSTGEYLGIRVLTTALSFLVGVVYAVLTCAPEALVSIILYLASSLGSSFIEGLHAVDQRNLRMDYIGRSYILQGLSSLLSFSLVLYLSNSIEWACGAMAISIWSVCALYDYPRTKQFEPIVPQIDFRSALHTLVRLSPLVVAQVCSSAALTFPRQILATELGSAALGIYSSVAAPSTIVQMGATYIYSPLMGEFASRFKQGREEGMKLFKKTSLAILLTSLMFSVVILVAGDWFLLLLYGNDIVAYDYLLLPAVLCTLITAFAWFFNDLLLTLRDFRGSFLGNVSSSVISLAISFPMVCAFGMNGVSFTGILSYSLTLLILAGFFNSVINSKFKKNSD
ncbi:MAG: polysaccharide biosynthesis protein [Coriobacteriaceae bacterium]|nr:polysaccharide biosynthesis protein [Coriobacteriaceae bacterium]